MIYLLVVDPDDKHLISANDDHALKQKVEDYFGAVSSEIMGDILTLTGLDVLKKEYASESCIVIPLGDDYPWAFEENATLKIHFRPVKYEEIESLVEEGISLDG